MYAAYLSKDISCNVIIKRTYRYINICFTLLMDISYEATTQSSQLYAGLVTCQGTLHEAPSCHYKSAYNGVWEGEWIPTVNN